ncbi:hypothetical protein QZH41_011968, partial [Actinostola sp. cb2023]
LSLFNSDAIALIDFSSLPHYSCMLTTVTKIPLFRLHGNENYNRERFCEHAVVMSADYVSYARATFKILDTFQWKKIALMFERSRFFAVVYFRTLAHAKDYKFSYIDLHYPNNSIQDNDLLKCEKTMKQLAIADADVILLYTGNKQLFLLGMVPKHVKAHKNHMVIGFSLPSNSSNEEEFPLAYDSVQVIAKSLENIHGNGLWLPGNDTNTLLANRQNLYMEVLKINTTGMTSSVQFDSNGRRVVQKLQIINLRNNTFSEVGTWTKDGNVQIDDGLHFNEHSLDETLLKGRKLSVVIAVTAPFEIKIVSSDGTIKYSGFCIEILEKLASELKFTYEIHEVGDGEYGSLINGEWNGMIRELIDRKADMIVGALTRSRQREHYISVTASFMSYTEKIIMKEDITEDKDYLQFMSPFSVEVWLILLFSLVVITISLYVLNYCSPYGCKDEQGNKTSEGFSMFNCLWFALACMLQQGADNTPSALSGRVLTGFFWFSILVWVATYTANLVAFFTVKNFVIPVTNLQEAISSRYQIGVVENSNIHSLIRSTEYELYKDASRKMTNLPKNFSQAMDWVRQGSYIHVTDGPFADYIAQRQPCDLVTYEGLQSLRSYTFALAQNDPHIQEISLGILRLRENGFIEKIRLKYWTNQCPSSDVKRSCKFIVV